MLKKGETKKEKELGGSNMGRVLWRVVRMGAGKSGEEGGRSQRGAGACWEDCGGRQPEGAATGHEQLWLCS